MHEWISTADRLPPFGELVIVAGQYTPLDADGHPLYPLPLAYRYALDGHADGWVWMCGEWRGICGINWWRPIAIPNE